MFSVTLLCNSKYFSMKEVQEYEKDLASIRNMMERSGKFISLSGLSGVLAGLYALIGAGVAYYQFQYPRSLFGYTVISISTPQAKFTLILIGTVVLAASLLTGLWFSHRKAKRHQANLWNATGRRLAMSLIIPLVTGGLFVLVLLGTGHYGVAAPACLVFYGLALINGSANLYDEVRYLGFSEILLGLISAMMPGYGLLFWAVGFGILHIIYGAVMHYRYDA